MIYNLIDKIKTKFWRRLALLMILPAIIFIVLICAVIVACGEIFDFVIFSFKDWKDTWDE